MNEYRYVAFCGAEFVEGADTLEELLRLVRRCWEAGCGEDVVIWDGRVWSACSSLATPGRR